MADEEQERFEDYLELEHYIEELQAGRAAHLPANLTPERAQIYRMAALFRSATSEATEPTPQFTEALCARLQELDEEESTQVVPRVQARLADSKPVAAPDDQPVTAPEQPAAIQKEQKEPQVVQPGDNRSRSTRKRARFFSRRSLLAGGAVAAASLVAGAGAGAAIEHAATSQTPPATVAAYATPSAAIVPSDIPTKLHLATTLTELGSGAVRFATEAVVGYVVRDDSEGASKGEVIAMSASCTHMGCIVQWQNADRRFYCPCHGGVFTEYGDPDNHASRMPYLISLPRLETVIKGDNVYVMVPDVSSL